MAIRWPNHYHPSRAPVHVSNERVIAAPADVVWQWLVDAERWPDWYPNSRAVRIVSGPRTALVLGSRFRWRTFGVPVSSEVVECDAPTRLAWTARGFGVDAYHAWYLEARDATSCRVLTEETQYGLVARLGAVLFPRRMWNGHNLWLVRLAERAQTGLPPA
jgi:Polyketide cyclase / dehydrase and lipid transport